MISVIVPVYQVEAFLRRCVDSILAQTYTDYELILVDDGSPNACGSICDAYAKADSRVRVIHRENGGLSAARNTGIDWVIANSDSQWISFVDSDDWLHPRYLEALLSAVEETGSAAAVCRFEKTGRDRGFTKLPDGISPELWTTEDFYCADKLTATVAWGKLYQKDALRHIRYPVGKIHEDEFITHILLFSSSRLAFVDLPLYYYYQNPASIMRSGWSPKHIAESDGLKEQLDYFLSRKFNRAAATAARAYLQSLYRNLIQAKKAVDGRAGTVPKLKKRLQRELIRCGKISGLKPGNAPWLYYEAFPYLLLPYRAYQKNRKTEKSH